MSEAGKLDTLLNKVEALAREGCDIVDIEVREGLELSNWVAAGDWLYISLPGCHSRRTCREYTAAVIHPQKKEHRLDWNWVMWSRASREPASIAIRLEGIPGYNLWYIEQRISNAGNRTFSGMYSASEVTLAHIMDFIEEEATTSSRAVVAWAVWNGEYLSRIKAALLFVARGDVIGAQALILDGQVQSPPHGRPKICQIAV